MNKNIKSFIYNTILVGAFLLGICSISGFAEGSANIVLCIGLLGTSIFAGLCAFNAEKGLHAHNIKANTVDFQLEINSVCDKHIEIAG